MYRKLGLSSGMGQLIVDSPQTKDYCEVTPGMCITQEAKNRLASINCGVPRVKGYSTRGGLRGMGALGGGLGRICSLYTQVTTRNLFEFNACSVKSANLPVCNTPPITTTQTPPTETFDEPEEEEDNEDNMFMIGGILAVLVVGGVGYAVFRNRKGKGKRKKGKR